MKKKIFPLTCSLLASGLFMSLAVGASLSNKPIETKASAPETGLNLIILGDGVENNAADWDISNGVEMQELPQGSGIYTGLIYSKGGQIAIRSKGDWNAKKYMFSDLENSGLDCLESAQTAIQATDDNIYNNGAWGYFRFTIDTTKDSKQVSVRMAYAGKAPTITGTGVEGYYPDGWYNWNCDSYINIFETDDGDIYTKSIKTIADNNWRIVAYKENWENLAGNTEFDYNSPKGDHFSTAGDNNIHSNDSANYVLRYDRVANRISVFDDSTSHSVTYKDNNMIIGSDVAEAGVNYEAKHYSSSDPNKRLEGWYLDAGLTQKYTTSALNADLTLYANYIDYSNTVYFAPGYDWVGVYVYAWDASGDILGGYPGTEMTSIGGGIYSYTFIGEQEPLHYIFSETGDPGNKTPDLDQYPNGKNLYIYKAALTEKESYQFVDENMIKAEEFGKVFLNNTNAGCSAHAFDSESWSTVETNVAEFINDADVLATILANQGVFKAAGLDPDDDYLDEANRRYVDILSKYSVNDFLHLSPSNNYVVRIGINSESTSNSLLTIVVYIVALAGVGIVLAYALKRKER